MTSCAEADSGLERSSASMCGTEKRLLQGWRSQLRDHYFPRLETGLSFFVVSIPGELVKRLEPEERSAPSACKSKGLNSGSGTNGGLKRS